MDALTEIAAAEFGDNTESLLLAAGLNEIQTLAIALGATHPETFTSIAGVGDLDVTCRSRYGRNRRFGREIVAENVLSSFSDISDLIDRIGELGYLPEGVVAARGAQWIIRRYGLKLPISDAVYRILNREADPAQAFDGILHGLTRGSFSGFLQKAGDRAEVVEQRRRKGGEYGYSEDEPAPDHGGAVADWRSGCGLRPA